MHVKHLAAFLVVALSAGCPAECELDEDCADANPCTQDQCNAGACENNADNAATPPQAAADDCLRQLCQDGALISAPDDAELPTQGPADDCVREVCSAGVISDLAANNEIPPNDGAACVVERCQGGEVVGDFAPAGAGGCNAGEYCDADTGCIQNVRDIFASQPNATLFGSADFAQATNFTGLALGDFDDDGVVDVAASEPDLSVNVNGGFRDSAGQVKVSFGPFVGEVDSSVNGSLTIFGAGESDRAGLALASCDFDGDGDDDLFVGSPNGDVGGFGAGHIIGVPGPLVADVDLNQIIVGVTPGLQLLGDQPTSFTPDRILCTDLNGDGAGDLIIGAANLDLAGRGDAGGVLVFLGGATLSGSKLLAEADLTIIGHSDAMHLGGAVAVGDLDGDEQPDLIAGAPAIGGNQLRPEGVVVIPGARLFDAAGAPRDATIDLATEAEAAYIDGGNRGLFGFSLITEDFNGDGTDDLAIGALLSSPQGRNQAGEVDIVYGQALFADTQIDNSSTQIFGFDPQDETGISIAAGDHNGDKRADLIVGAHRADGLNNNRNGSGEVFVFFGGAPLAPGQILDLTAASPGLVIFGGQAGDAFGKHLQMFDVDNNEKADLIIAAQQDDTPVGRLDAGSISIVLAPPQN